jgi:AraC-like DNA-binding protein
MKNIRQEPIENSANFTTDSQGITRNNLLMSHLNQLSIELLDHGYFIGNLQWNQYGVHSPFARIYYMVADRGWLDTAQGKIDLIPGTMYLIPPRTRVDLRTNGRIEKFYFHVTCRYGDMDILDNINRCFTLPLQPDLLHKLLAAYSGGQLPDLLTIKGLVYQTLASFFRDCLPDISERLALANEYKVVYSYIEQNLSAQLSALKVCDSLGLPYETYRRKFRRDNGITLHQYIADRLIQRASLGLLLTRDTVQQIAGQLGFADEFYFSRFFKQKMGYSPREYRRINAVLRH